MNVNLSRHLERLAGHTGPGCVSLYMPTYRVGPQATRESPIRLKNLLGQAEGRLTEQGMRAAEARDLLRGARQLQDDPLFWQHQEDGLALFLAPGVSDQMRLPLHFDELVVVGDRFHLKPLLPLLNGDGRMFVLSLSENGVHLYEGTRHSLKEREAQSLPQSLADALRLDDLERQRNQHVINNPRFGGGPGGQVHGHGHGVGVDDAKDRLLRYFRKINDGLWELLREQKDRPPLVLAGVEYYFPIYREANTYPALREQGVPGSPGGMKPEELRRRAWAIVEPHFQQALQRDSELVLQAQGTGRATTSVEETVRAALDGKVATLFVANGVQCWGQIDPESRQALTHDKPAPGDQDLLDLAAIQTFLKEGTVYAVPREQVPGRRDVAALLRY